MFDMKDSQDMFEVKQSQDLFEVKDSQDIFDVKETQDVKNPSDSQDKFVVKESQDMFQVEDSQDSINPDTQPCEPDSQALHDEYPDQVPDSHEDFQDHVPESQALIDEESQDMLIAQGPSKPKDLQFLKRSLNELAALRRGGFRYKNKDLQVMLVYSDLI